MEPPGAALGGGGRGSMRRPRKAVVVVLGATAVMVATLALLPSSGAGHGDKDVGVRRLLRAAVESPLAAGAQAVGDLNGDGAAHKSLWPLDRNDVVTLVLATLGLVIAAGGGIGGGGG